jgi:hypothetical protein
VRVAYAQHRQDQFNSIKELPLALQPRHNALSDGAGDGGLTAWRSLAVEIIYVTDVYDQIARIQFIVV